ncbi:MAG: hypothetical protein FWG31_03215 [Oscillospiraceae bacterium]|nr:hypothetical protein [Oscillospiraceae bacterium]
MKKVLSLSLSGILILALLVACGGGLSGTYVGSEGEEYTFKGDKVTMSYGGVSIEGTYKIDGDTIEMTIMGETESTTYKKDGKTIEIGGETFTKK